MRHNISVKKPKRVDYYEGNGRNSLIEGTEVQEIIYNLNGFQAQPRIEIYFRLTSRSRLLKG